MYDIDVEQKLVIASNYDVIWNQVLNKIKPKLKDLHYENSFSNCVDYLIKLSQIIRTRPSGKKKIQNLHA